MVNLLLGLLAQKLIDLCRASGIHPFVCKFHYGFIPGGDARGMGIYCESRKKYEILHLFGDFQSKRKYGEALSINICQCV